MNNRIPILISILGVLTVIALMFIGSNYEVKAQQKNIDVPSFRLTGIEIYRHYDSDLYYIIHVDEWGKSREMDAENIDIGYDPKIENPKVIFENPNGGWGRAKLVFKDLDQRLDYTISFEFNGHRKKSKDD